MFRLRAKRTAGLAALLACSLAMQTQIAVSAAEFDLDGLDMSLFTLREEIDLPAFQQLTEIDWASVWSYSPSEIGAETLTSVIIVVPDDTYETAEEAADFLAVNGLLYLAETEQAGVILMNRSGEEWSEQDVVTYDYIIDAVAGTQDEVERTNLGYTTYLSQVYMIGEGSGATFINEYMTQHCDVLAAVATFGGEMPEEVPEYAALPAYIIGGSEEAIEFYKSINHTDSEESENGETTYYNSEYSTEQVVVRHLDDTELSADRVLDAFYGLLRYVNRSSITTPVWYGGYEAATENGPLTLMDRPNVEELELVFNGPCEDESIGQSIWYEWIPEEALEEDNEELYSLVIVYHGAGDDPLFEAEQNGWVQMAGEERFIVVSAEDNNADGIDMMGEGNTDRNLEFINYIIDKYPVDTSRIYLTGFSLGGSNTIQTAGASLDLFAGIASISHPSEEASWDNLLNYEEYGYDSETMDLPVFYLVGTNDTTVLPTDEEGNRYFSSNVVNLFNEIFELNEIDAYIDVESLDYDAYPWYGFETSFNTELSFVNQHGIEINTLSYYDEDNVEMLRAMILTDCNHNHYTEIARYAWDYLKHFSRDTETGGIIYE